MEEKRATFLSELAMLDKSLEDAVAQKVMRLIERRLGELLEKGRLSACFSVSPASEVLDMWHTDPCPYDQPKMEKALRAALRHTPLRLTSCHWTDVTVEF